MTGVLMRVVTASCLVMTSALMANISTGATAQTYPSQTIKIFVPTPPGGIADLLSRILAQKLSEAGTVTIAETHAGAGGIVAADSVAKAAPDGYTLYMGFHPTNAILPHLQKLPYDAARDFQPVILIGASPNVLVVHPSVPAETPAELVAYLRANPGKLAFASPGNGSSDHLAGEQFRLLHNVDIVHVPYKGAGPAVQDLIAGHVHMMFNNVSMARELIVAGKVRPLGLLAAERLAILPDVPTMAEQGMPGLEGGPWFGLMAPAKTPRPIVDWLNAETKKVFSAPEVRERLTQLGMSLPLGTPEDFGKFVAKESDRWSDVIKRAKIKL